MSNVVELQPHLQNSDKVQVTVLTMVARCQPALNLAGYGAFKCPVRVKVASDVPFISVARKVDRMVRPMLSRSRLQFRSGAKLT
jgi:hypothetical protein